MKFSPPISEKLPFLSARIQLKLCQNQRAILAGLVPARNDCFNLLLTCNYSCCHKEKLINSHITIETMKKKNSETDKNWLRTRTSLARIVNSDLTLSTESQRQNCEVICLNFQVSLYKNPPTFVYFSLSPFILCSIYFHF